MVKKTAVLISGEYRTFDACRRSMTFFDDPAVDVYFCTWSTSCVVRFLTNQSYAETITEGRIRAHVGERARIIIDDIDTVPNAAVMWTTYNSKMIHRWVIGVQAIQQSGVDYERVVITRPDLYFTTPWDIHSMHPAPGELYVGWSDPSATNKLNDILMCGDSATVYNLTTSNLLNSWVSAGQPDWHHWWYQYTVSNHINPKPLEVGILLCRYPSKYNDDIQTHYKNSIDWRNDTIRWQAVTFGTEEPYKYWDATLVNSVLHPV